MGKFFAMACKEGEWFTFGFNLTKEHAIQVVKDLCESNQQPGRVVRENGDTVYETPAPEVSE